jgi:ABC-type antimicrobial peptide transport system permease subunit
MALTGDVDTKFYHQFNTLHFELKNKTHNGKLIAALEKTWKEIYPEVDFELNFLDDTMKQFYEQEQKTTVLLRWATGLAILISCLGLLGLVIHTTERRTKEIGIRKVLGASLAELNALLCKEFIMLVGIAFAIATPIAWWALDQWLQGFAYKTELSWWVFVLSGILMLLVALIVITVKTTSSANADPVRSLRTE